MQPESSSRPPASLRGERTRTTSATGRSRCRSAARRRAAARTRFIRFEELESRYLLAARVWDGGAGTSNWLDAANWDGDTLPGAGDDVTIDIAGSNPTITVAGNVTIQSLVAREAVTFSSGTFTANSVRFDTANGTLSGARLASATVETGTFAQLRMSSGTLDGITLASGSQAVTNTNAAITVLGGLTVDGSLTLGAGSTDGYGLFFAGDQTLGGSGHVYLSGNDQRLRLSQANMTLTIGAGLTVHATVTAGSTGIGPHVVANTAVINHGTLRSEGTGTFNLGTGTNLGLLASFTNAASGALESAGGTFLVTAPTFTNQGAMNVAAGTFTISSATWSNTGAIGHTGGTINFGGSFTVASLGTYNRQNGTAGTTNLTGTLNNAGTALNLAAASGGWGTWTLAGGRINGGTVATSDGAQLRLSTGTLDGVILAASAEAVTNSNAVISILGGLTVDGSLTLGAGAADGYGLFFAGDQTLGGSGHVYLSGNDQRLRLSQANMTLTIGAGLTVHATVTLGSTGIGPHNVANTHVINHGTLRSEGTGTFNLGAGPNSGFLASFTNAASGALESAGGTFLVTAPTFTNQGAVNVAAGTFTISSTTWSNTGAIGHTGGTINFGGLFTVASLGTYNRQNGTAGTTNLTGTLNNAGTALNLAAASGGWGTWTLAGGRINGGTVATSDGAQLRLSTGTLDGVILAAGAEAVTNSNAVISILGGLTVDGSLTLGAGAADGYGLFFAGDQTLGGSGHVYLSGNDQRLRLSQANMTLTIGAGLTVHATVTLGSTGIGPHLVANTHVINHGTLRSEGTGTFNLGAGPNSGFLASFTNAASGALESAGGTFLVTAPTFTNQGAMNVAAGTFTISSATWSNTGAIGHTGGTINFSGSFTVAGLGTYNRQNGTAGTTNLTGTLNNAGTALNLAAASGGWGTWTLAGGRINGGTVATSDGAQLRLSTGTLDGVTLAIGSQAVTNPNAAITVLGSLTVDGSLTLGAGSSNDYGLYFAGDQTLGGSGHVYLSGNDQRLRLSQANMTLTIGAGLTVHATVTLGSSGIGPHLVANTHVINHGTLRSEGTGTFNLGAGPNSGFLASFTNAASGALESAGGTFLVTAPTFTNQGAMNVAAGTFTISSATWSNTGAIGHTGGTINFSGSFTVAGLGTYNRQNGTAGTTNLTGTLNNAGTALNLAAASGGWGTWTLAGGRINGGTVATSDGAQLRLSTGTLDGVTLAIGSQAVTNPNAAITVLGSLTVDGSLTLGAGSSNDYGLYFAGDQTLGGSGHVYLSGNDQRLRLSQANMTLTIGAGLTVHATVTTGSSGIGPHLVANTHVINHGTLRSEGTGTFNLGAGPNSGFLASFTNAASGTLETVSGTFTVTAPSFTNHGTITVPAGTFIINSSTWSNSGAIDVAGGTFTISTSTWSNTGVMEITGGALNLGGTFATSSIMDPGRFQRTAGTINLNGTLNNAGSTLEIDDLRGSWTLANTSRIVGGTVLVSGTNKLQYTSSSTTQGGTLDGTTLRHTTPGGVVLDITGQEMWIENSLTLDGTIQLKSAADLIFNGPAGGGGSQSITTSNPGTTSGVLEFIRTGSTYSGLSANPDSLAVPNTYTIGPGITLRGARYYVGYTTNRANWINQGTIAADVTGEDAVLEGTSWTNAPGGVWRVENGGILQIGYNKDTTTWANEGTIQINPSAVHTGSRLDLNGSVTDAGLGTVQRNGGTIYLEGRIAGGLSLDDSLGDIELRGGGLQGGTFSVVPGSTARLIATGTNSYLDGVTLASPIDMESIHSADVVVENGLTINTVQRLGNASGSTAMQLRFRGNQSVRTDGGGTFLFGANISGSTFFPMNAGDTLTIEAGVTLRGTSAVIGSNYGKIYNFGTIRRDEGAGQFTVQLGDGGRNAGLIDTTVTSLVAGSRTIITAGGSQSWANVGTIQSAGALVLGLQTSESWANLGEIVSTGGSVEFNGLFTQSTIGQFTRDPASLVRVGLNATVTGDVHLDDVTGSWIMAGALEFGRLTTAGAAQLIVTGGAFRAYTLDGETDFNTSNVSISIYQGLTLHTTIRPGAANGATYTRFFIQDNQTWTGSGTVIFGSNTSNEILSNSGTLALTIDPGLTIRGHQAKFNQLAALTVLGVVGPDVAGGLFNITATNFSNQGKIQTLNGSELRINPNTTQTTTNANLTNATLIGSAYESTLNGGTWHVGPASILRLYYNTTGVSAVEIHRLNAHLILDGADSRVLGGSPSLGYAAHNALESLSAIDGNGHLTVTGGRPFVPATNFVNAGQLDVDAGSTFGATDIRPAAGLISHYQADGNANDSAGPHHGTVAGGAGYAAGRLGSGFLLDGVDDYVTIQDTPALRPSSVTVAAWVDFNSTTTAPKMIVAKPVGAGTGDSFALWYAGTFRAAITDAAGTTDEISFSQTADAFDWHHVAMTFDDAADTLTLFYDGVARATRTSTRTIVYDSQPLLIGADINSGTTGQFFPGVIDEVRLYDRALTAAEIHALYENFADVAYTQTAGATRVDGLLSPALGVTLTGGKLGGAGTVAADVQNTGATLSPGNSPELLDITGDYVQGPDATLLVELAGRDPDVPQFDRLRVTGTATLAGTLRVELLNEFEPTPGDTFPVVSSALRSGQFDQLELPAPGGPGRELAPVYTAQGFTLLARSVPPVEFEFVTTQTHSAGDSYSPQDVVVDGAGNAYVTGYFSGSVDLDGAGPALPLTTSGITAAYVAKLAPTGTLLWQRQLDGTLAAEASGLGIALDPTNGDVVFTGRITHNVAITDGTTTASLLGDASSRPFIVRLTGSGDVLWGRSTAHAGLVSGVGNDVAVGATGVSYIVGQFSGTVDFDTSASDASRTATGASGDAFLWAIDGSGGFVAVERLGGVGNDVAHTVGVASQSGTDRVWMAGSFQAATNGLAALTLAVPNIDDAFVLSAQVSGTSFAATYAQSYGGPGFDYATDLAVGGDGAVVVVGSFEHTVDFDVAPDRAFTLASSGDTDGFVLKLAADGQFAWARAVGGYRGDVAQTVALDSQGDVYLGGVFEDFVDFDPLESSQVAFAFEPQAFVARYTASGQLGWVTDLSGTAGALSQTAGVAAGEDGRVVAVGDADVAGGGTVDFDPGTGVQNPLLAGESRGFVWSLRQKAVPVAEIVGLPAATPAEGDVLALSARVTDSDSDYFTYAWAVRRDGADYAAGTGSTLAFFLADQGNYTVDLTVFDESGNADHRSALIRVSNAAPIFHATEFGAAVALGGGTAAAGDGLGTALASGGGFLLAGEPGEDVGAAAGAGSVTVYDAATGGIIRSLVAPVAEAGAQFGAAVAVVGPYAVVGAPGSTGGGRVYIFRLADGSLTQSFSSPAGGAADRFGAALTAVGNLLGIGAPGRAVAGLANVGAAYLFDPASGEQLRSYANSTPQAQDEFGVALTSVGGGLLIGAPGDDSTGLDAGAAYLLDAGSGQLLATLTNPHPTFPGSRFGSVLSSTGFIAVVGAPLDDSAATDAGGVFVYDLDPASARLGKLLETLRSPNSGAGRFGSSLAARGHRVLIGAVADNQSVVNSGTAFLFDIDPQSPTFGTSRATFKKGTPAGADQFGAAVTFLEDDVVVAAPFDDSTSVDGGRLYQFDAQSFVMLSAPSVTESGQLTLTGSFFDPGADDTHSLLIDWDTWEDGAPLERVELRAGHHTFQVSHQYLDDNPLLTALDLAAIRISVSDRTDDLLVVDQLVGPDAVQRYDGTTGASGGTLMNGGGPPGADDVGGIAVGPDGDLYVAFNSFFAANPIYRYDLATGAPLGLFASGPGNPNSGIQTLAFGPDGTLYVLDVLNNLVLRFNSQSGAPVPSPSPAVLASIFRDPGAGAIFSSPRGLTFGPDGNLYLVYRDSSMIVGFDGATGAPLGTYLDESTGLPFFPSDILFGAGGSSLYLLADSLVAGRAIFEYSFDTKELQRTMELGWATGPDHFTLDSNGDLLWSNGGTVVKKFDGETGELIGEFAPEGLTAAGYLVSAPPQDSTGTGVSVVNAAPTVTVRAAPSPAAGQYTLEALAQDIGTRDNLTYSWTITGGTTVGSTSSSSFTFTPTGAAVSVLLTVADDDSGIVTSRTQVVIGTAGNDAITVNNGNAVVNGASISYAASTNRVVVFGLGGNDTINGSGASTMPMELIGGFGNDTLTGGSQNDFLIGNNPGDYALANPYTGDVGNDSLTGGAGNDTIDGGLGNDTMTGGNGNDYYIEVPGSADLLDESTSTTTGVDTIDYQLAYSGIVFSLSKSGLPQIVNPLAPPVDQHTVEIRGSFENLYGSTFDDALTGNLADNSLRGGEGDDRLFGGDLDDSVTGGLALEDGNDSLAGGLGDDTALGGTGDDIIFGGDENEDTMLGSTGISDDDSLVGGWGDDTLLGGAGDDITFGGDEDEDTMLGGTGISDDDWIAGGTGDDTLLGGTGDDIIFGGDENEDTLLGSTGISDDDSLVGGWGDDTLLGGTGDDITFGGDEDEDTMLGGTGISDDDSLVGGLGDDTLLGGTGDDIIFGGDENEDTLLGSTGISDDDSLVGGWGDDTLLGGTGDDITFGGDEDEDTMLGGTGISDNDSLVGGLGDDTLLGGTGDDIIFGGDEFDTLLGSTGISDDDSLVGGWGDDTLLGGTGDDITFGGDEDEDTMLGGTGISDDDSLVGGLGDDTLLGGTGDDIIFGGDEFDTIVGGLGGDAGNDSLVGGAGNDTLIGGSGDDISYGSDEFDTVPSGVGSDPGSDSLVGGAGDDTLLGGGGNDIVIGGAGNDLLSGHGGVDILEGGSGTDRILEVHDADMVLTPTTLTIGSVVERTYDLELATLGGGPGGNMLDASAFPGAVILIGLGGDDLLVGGPQNDQLLGGSGNDTLLGGSGDDVLDGGSGDDRMEGGTGNDTYVERPGSTDVLIDTQGIDSLDFSGADFAVDLDLSLPGPQVVDTAGNIVELVGSFENVYGSSFDDKLYGSGQRNILYGGGGIDYLDGGDAADTLQGSFPQLVFLDFDSATDRGEKDYTIEERNAIQARLEQDYAAPFSVTFTQTAPPIGKYTAILLNAGSLEENEALVAGEAAELDWRNANASSRANINVNAFLGRRGQPAATSENYVGLTSTIIAHELAHLFGLRHNDSFGPLGINPDTGLPFGMFAGLLQRGKVSGEISLGVTVPETDPSIRAYGLKNGPVLLQPAMHAGRTDPVSHPSPAGTIFESDVAIATFVTNAAGQLNILPLPGHPPRVVAGALDPVNAVVMLQWNSPPIASRIQISYEFDPLRPGYRGPLDATETPQHIIASPASVRTSLASAVGDTYFGERELIKLAFADASRSVFETSLPAGTAPASIGGSARYVGVLPALAVPNLLPAAALNAGTELRVRAANVVGSIQRTGGGLGPSENDVYAFQGTAGALLTVEVLSASLRQRYQPIDSVVRLYGEDGLLLDYFGQPAVNDDGFDNQDSLLMDVVLPADGTYFIEVDTFHSPALPDTDTGGYELFLYSSESPIAGQRQRGAGDVLIGGADGDVLIGSAGDDRFVGSLSEDVFLGASPNDLVAAVANPNVSIVFGTPEPAVGQPVEFHSVVTDLFPGADLTYAWTADSPTETFQGTLDMFTFTPPEPGVYVVTLTVTDDVGESGSDSVSFEIAIVNHPAAISGDSTGTVTEDDSVDTITGTLDISDSDPGEDQFQTPTSLDGLYGSFTFDPLSGNWTYTLDNGRTTTDALAAGQTVTDSLGATSLDGTASRTIVVTVVGRNDAAFLSAAQVDLSEDDLVPGLAPDALGTLTIDDVDSLEVFQAATIPGSYGVFTVAPTGQWTFDANSAHDEFEAGQVYINTFTVAAVDGTTSTVTIRIAGTNDAAVVSAAQIDLSEDDLVPGLAPDALGTLTIDDVDSPEVFQAATIPGSYGVFTVAPTGQWTFDANSAHDEFEAGQVYINTFTVAAADGTTSTVTIRIAGTNDAAVVSAAQVDLSEDDLVPGLAPDALGTLTIDDVDSPEVFQAATIPGSYGVFTVAPTGQWTFDANSAHDEFEAGQVYINTFTVAAVDGTTSTVTIRIAGTNDAAVVSAAQIDLSEDDLVPGLAPDALGTLTIDDVDSPEVFQAATIPGSYGVFTVAPTGQWTFDANSAHDEFEAGQVYINTFTVAAADGTTSTVTIRIAGTNDAAVVSAAQVDLSEDDLVPGLAPDALGTLTIDDVDSPEVFQAATIPGSYGVFTVAPTGQWTFDANSAHDEFEAGQTYTEIFTVTTADGTTTTVTIHIAGTNDAALLSEDVRNLTEGNATADISSSGTLTISDVDSSATFVAQTNTVGDYGTFSVDPAGQWSYIASSAHDEFVAGQSYEDIFTVLSADGTSTTVTIRMLGTAEDSASLEITSLEVSTASIREGEMVTLFGTYTSTVPAASVAVTGVAVWSDGVTTPAVVHSDGTFRVDRVVADDSPSGTPQGTLSAEVTLTQANQLSDTVVTPIVLVDNALPEIVSVSTDSPGGAFMGLRPVNLSANFTDAGVSDTHQAVIDWGDGHVTAGVISEVAGSGSVSGSHLYAQGGIFTVTVRVLDDDGGWSEATTHVEVAGIGLNQGRLEVIGTAGRDWIWVRRGRDDDEVRVYALFHVGQSWCGGHDDGEDDWDDAPHGTQLYVFSASDVASLMIFGKGGDDRLKVHSPLSLPVTLDGGTGDDVLVGGSGDDTLVDQFGDNRVYAGAGDDTVTVGDGDNRIWTDGGDDTIVTGQGDNEVHAGRGNDTVTAGAGDDRIWTDGGNDVIHAGNGRNEIRAGDGHNVIYAGAGPDKIWSGSGDDWIDAGDGRNQVDAGDGNDTIRSGAGDDEIDAGRGDDWIEAGEGRNEIDAGEGDDTIFSGAGNDAIDAGSGDDWVQAGNGRNEVDAGSGDDRVVTGSGQDDIDGGSGDDWIDAGSGNDEVRGGAGSDILIGGEGNDTLDGESGRDLIIGGLGADTLRGGSDDDLLIGGTTQYDTDSAAMDRILSEWSRNVDYTARVNHVTLGQGTLHSTGLKLDSQTVAGDGLLDTLEGEAGRDLFFYNYEGNGVRDQAHDYRSSGSQSERRIDTD